jgi:hypothetical protein
VISHLRYVIVAVAAAALVGTGAAATTLEAPQITLKAHAGILTGVQGSTCVSSATLTQCADSIGPHPQTVAIVRPGGRLVLRAEALLSGPSVSAGLLGCGTGWRKHIRGQGGRWTLKAPRRPGAYELLLTTRFQTEATHGDTSVAFGVVVSRTKARRIVPASQYAVC